MPDLESKKVEFPNPLHLDFYMDLVVGQKRDAEKHQAASKIPSTSPGDPYDSWQKWWIYMRKYEKVLYSDCVVNIHLKIIPLFIGAFVTSKFSHFDILYFDPAPGRITIYDHHTIMEDFFNNHQSIWGFFAEFHHDLTPGCLQAIQKFANSSGPFGLSSPAQKKRSRSGNTQPPASL